MGSFDRVNFACPSCGDGITMQSKSGACEFAEYEADETPLDVASGLKDHVQCGRCDKQFVVDKPRVVSLSLEDHDEC